MPLFKVVPSDTSVLPIQVNAFHSSAALYAAHRLPCDEADVYEEDRYLFSLREDDNGLWCIFKREEVD